MVVDLTRSIRHNYCMNSNIPFIHCSKKTVVNVNVNMSLHATMTRMDSNQEIPQNLLISMLLSTEICTLLALIHFLWCKSYLYNNIGQKNQSP